MTLSTTKSDAKPLSKIRNEWENLAWKVLTAEMNRQKISYKVLSRRLEEMGIRETPDQINRKVNRKKFSAAFFLTCLAAMKVTTLQISLPKRETKMQNPQR